MPLSRASTRGRYSLIEGVTTFLYSCSTTKYLQAPDIRPRKPGHPALPEVPDIRPPARKSGLKPGYPDTTKPESSKASASSASSPDIRPP